MMSDLVEVEGFLCLGASKATKRLCPGWEDRPILDPWIILKTSPLCLVFVGLPGYASCGF